MPHLQQSKMRPSSSTIIEQVTFRFYHTRAGIRFFIYIYLGAFSFSMLSVSMLLDKAALGRRYFHGRAQMSSRRSNRETCTMMTPVSFLPATLATSHWTGDSRTDPISPHATRTYARWSTPHFLCPVHGDGEGTHVGTRASSGI
jgi:hypothetical protein